jgi:hypothetical protein
LATITPTPAIQSGYQAPYSAIIVQWGPMQNGDVGAAPSIDTTAYTDVTFQVEGTFGAGGAVAILGSVDGVNFRACRNPQGTTIAATQAGLYAVQEGVAHSLPSVTAGDGTTSLVVSAFYRRRY